MNIFRLVVAMALIFSPSLVFGQLVGSVLEVSQFELGYAYKSFHRDMDGPYDFNRKFNWSIRNLYIKYGIIDNLTITGEVFLILHQKDKIDETNYRGYTIGAGLIYLLFNVKNYNILISGHFIERFGYDKSMLKNHQGSINFLSSLQIERYYKVYGQKVILWIAPAYIYDEYKLYPGGRFPSHRFVAHNKFGLLFGVNAEIRNRIRPFTHIVYADYFQPRVGIGYKF